MLDIRDLNPFLYILTWYGFLIKKSCQAGFWFTALIDGYWFMALIYGYWFILRTWHINYKLSWQILIYILYWQILIYIHWLINLQNSWKECYCLLRTPKNWQPHDRRGTSCDGLVRVCFPTRLLTTSPMVQQIRYVLVVHWVWVRHKGFHSLKQMLSGFVVFRGARVSRHGHRHDLAEGY